MERYVAVATNPPFNWFAILDCETDELVTHQVENKFKTMETKEWRFSHREAAEYCAAKLNESAAVV